MLSKHTSVPALPRWRALRLPCLLLALCLCGTAVRAQTGAAAAPQSNAFPNRSLRLVVPGLPGGGTDILGRHVANRLQDVLRQPVVVENRSGAGSLVGTEHVARSPADGYSILIGGIFNMVMNKALIPRLSYDPLRDFAPIGFLSAYPFVLLVRADLPINTLADLVQQARNRPGQFSYGSAGLGTLQHVWGNILFKSLGLELLHVPFKGAAPAHQEMLAGRLDLLFDNVSASKQYLQSGRMRGLVVSGANRSADLPQVPTVNETGLTRFEGESWFGLFVPAATPPAALARLREALLQVTREPAFVNRIERDGGRVLEIPATAQRAFMQQELDRWTQLIRQHAVAAE